MGGPAVGRWVLGSGHGEGMGGLVPPLSPPNACLTAFIRGYLSETGMRSVDNEQKQQTAFKLTYSMGHVQRFLKEARELRYRYRSLLLKLDLSI